MKTINFISFIVLAWFVSSCSLGQSLSAPDVTPPASPMKGQSTMVGRVLSRDTGEPLTNEVIRLAEVFRQGEKGAYVLDVAFSPGARTDDKGYFIFENIPANEYVIVVGKQDAEYDVIEEPDTKLPKVFLLQSDQVLDVGEIRAKPVFHP